VEESVIHGKFPFAVLLVLAAICSACWLEPKGERPGFGISGELTTEPVADWSFTDEIEEIVIETRTWYRLPHSVTIWCVSIDGELYVAADYPDYPEESHWVTAVVRDPNVRLGIADRIYERRLESVTDSETTDSIDRAFAEKYDYDMDEDPDTVTAYWRVVDRT
jgi:hypothetical protein